MGLSHGNRRSVYKGSCHLDENAAVIKMFCIFFFALIKWNCPIRNKKSEFVYCFRP